MWRHCNQWKQLMAGSYSFSSNDHIENESKWPPFPHYVFKCIFINENLWNSIKIALKIVPRGSANNIPPLVQIMAWRRPGKRPLSEPTMVRLLTHIWVTRLQWIKTLKRVCDIIDWHGQKFDPIIYMLVYMTISNESSLFVTRCLYRESVDHIGVPHKNWCFLWCKTHYLTARLAGKSPTCLLFNSTLKMNSPQLVIILKQSSGWM